MNKKQMEKKVDKIIETIRQTILDFCEYGENEDEARHYAEDCREEIRKLVEEVEEEALEKIVGLSIEMEGSFNNAMFNSGFGTALDEIYYRLSDGKFLDEVLGEKDKGTN